MKTNNNQRRQPTPQLEFASGDLSTTVPTSHLQEAVRDILTELPPSKETVLKVYFGIGSPYGSEEAEMGELNQEDVDEALRSLRGANGTPLHKINIILN